MAVQKIGRWIAAFLFISAALALIELLGNSPQHEYIMIIAVFFQLLFSIFLYLSAVKLANSKKTKPYKYCCWVGIIYGLFLGVVMGLRQYEEFGKFTPVLSITTIIFAAIFSSPFLWSIKKLKEREGQTIEDER